MENVEMVNRDSFEYWSYNKKIFHIINNIITIERNGLLDDTTDDTVMLKTNNELFQYVKSMLGKLLKGRGFELDNCNLCFNNRYIHYMPNADSNFIIGLQDYHIPPNSVEIEFLDNYNKIINDEADD